MTTVLLIDDDELVRRPLGRLLAREGYEVLPYPDGAPAFDEVDFACVDIVVAELLMPTGGVCFIEILRSRGIKVPVVAVSGVLRMRDVRSLRTLGVQHFMEKPFPIEDLLDAIAEAVPAG